MLRSTRTRKLTGKQENARSTSAGRRSISAVVTTLPIARGPATTARKIEARLKRMAKESFQNMGED